MAVTQESDGDSKKSVEEPTQHCGGEGADPGPCRVILQRKYDGPSTRPKGIRKDVCGVVRSYKLGGNGMKDRKSDRLSIDDIEVIGYLNNKEEIHRKRIFWEAMNEEYVKAKKQKQAAETKKRVAVKKATKTTVKVEPKRHSSKINYDALKSLGVDVQERSESSRSSRADCHSQNSAMHGSKESWYEEDESDISYGNNETFGGHEEDEMHYQYRDEHFYDDFDF